MTMLASPAPSAPSPILATRETLTLSLPCHWALPLLYGDTTDLPHDEAAAFSRWLQDTCQDLGHGKPIRIGHIKDQPYFARYHDAAEYGVLPCLCIDIDLIVE